MNSFFLQSTYIFSTNNTSREWEAWYIDEFNEFWAYNDLNEAKIPKIMRFVKGLRELLRDK